MNLPDADFVLVDSDTRVLKALRSALQRGWRASAAQARVRMFSSTVAALDSLRDEPADVVLADYRMPGVDGVELLRQVREVLPCSGRILMSGPADFTFLLKAVSPNAVGRVLLKPWIDEELLDAVRQAVELGRLLRENAELTDRLHAQRSLLTP